MLLGIVVGVAFSAEVSARVVLVTMVTSSFALGISTGVSVYEAESLERARKISELESALFMDLKGTKIEKSAKAIIALTVIINFLTPLVSCAVAMTPFILTVLNILEVHIASWFSAALILGTLFFAGIYLGKIGKRSPWIKGLRMVIFGLLAFTIGFLLNSLI